jgi:hypothetical protein
VAAVLIANILEIGQEGCFDDFYVNFKDGSCLVKN